VPRFSQSAEEYETPDYYGYQRHTDSKRIRDNRGNYGIQCDTQANENNPYDCGSPE
jgi:hypothetical protein